MPSTLIMPCAGRSSRFDDQRPKWTLTHPNGNLMIMESLYGLDITNVNRIITTVVKKHIDQNKINLDRIAEEIFSNKAIQIEFLVLNDFTLSQSDTIYQTIKQSRVEGSIFIKDCDNYFNTIIQENNSVCITSLDNNINAINKSYVSLNKYGFLSSIVEKQVIGNQFCVGGYSFQDAEEFKQSFEEIKSINHFDQKEMYISHVIQQMLLNGKVFEVQRVNNYLDWGTLQDWQRYVKQFRTLFVDLDGVLVENSSEFVGSHWGHVQGLMKNIHTINELYDSNKTMIIITTARKSKLEEFTLNQLKSLNVKYHKIIFDLPHAPRVVINDYANSNPYPTAVAICIKRDDDNLNELI